MKIVKKNIKVKQMAESPEEWFKCYFKNKSKSSNFHIKASMYLLKYSGWFAVQSWNRGK